MASTKDVFIIATHHGRLKCIVKHYVQDILPDIRPLDMVVFDTKDIFLMTVQPSSEQFRPLKLKLKMKENMQLPIPSDMMIIFIRHGLGKHNLQKKQKKVRRSKDPELIQGKVYQDDIPNIDKFKMINGILTGIIQTPPQQVYFCASPLKRCIQTITCICVMLSSSDGDKRYNPVIYILPNIHEIVRGSCRQSLNAWWASRENTSQLVELHTQERLERTKKTVQDMMNTKNICPISDSSVQPRIDWSYFFTEKETIRKLMGSEWIPATFTGEDARFYKKFFQQLRAQQTQTQIPTPIKNTEAFGRRFDQTDVKRLKTIQQYAQSRYMINETPIIPQDHSSDDGQGT